MYLVDKEIAQRFATVLDIAPDEGRGNYDKFLQARSYVDFLEYISFLANHDRIDNDYISVRIKCDITHVKNIAPKGPASLFSGIHEINKYVAEGRNTDCSGSPPPSN